MAKKTPEQLQRIRKTYQDAQLRIQRLIIDKEARGNVVDFQREVLDGVNAELRALDQFADKWAAGEIPAAYEGGIRKAYEEYRAANVPAREVAANNDAIRNLVDNATGSLTDAHRFVGRRMEDAVRQASLDAVAVKIAAGETVKQTKANLIDKLQRENLTAVLDKRGRPISLDAYASMVARTTTREATNEGTMQEITDLGDDLVQMTRHFSTCPVCAVLEGRVYSISGKDKRYPPLSSAFPGEYKTIHPNCTHSVTPYFREFDDDPEATEKESNRPMELTPEQRKSVEDYQREQAKKTARRKTRREWEAARAADPENTPKTLSGFMAVKRANGERYKTISTARRAAAEKAAEPVKKYKSTAEAFASVKYTGIDKEFADEIDARLLDLANKYPLELPPMQVRALAKDGIYGHYQMQATKDGDKVRARHEIVVSNKNQKNRQMSAASHERNDQYNGAPSRGPLQTIDHEYAHAIDSAYRHMQDPEPWRIIKSYDGRAMRSLTREDGRIINTANADIYSADPMSKAIYEKMRAYYGQKPAEFEASVLKYCGKYATTSYGEFFAEAFSAYRNVEPAQQSEFIKLFGREFEAKYKEMAKIWKGQTAKP